jgi:hypothetical protein
MGCIMLHIFYLFFVVILSVPPVISKEMFVLGFQTKIMLMVEITKNFQFTILKSIRDKLGLKKCGRVEIYQIGVGL